MKPNVVVHIEELVLHGFAPSDRWRIADAVQGELARAIAEQGIAAPIRSVDVAQLRGAPISVAPAARAEALGAQIAGSVHGALKK